MKSRCRASLGQFTRDKDLNSKRKIIQDEMDIFSGRAETPEIVKWETSQNILFLTFRREKANGNDTVVNRKSWESWFPYHQSSGDKKMEQKCLQPGDEGEIIPPKRLEMQI